MVDRKILHTGFRTKFQIRDGNRQTASILETFMLIDINGKQLMNRDSVNFVTKLKLTGLLQAYGRLS